MCLTQYCCCLFVWKESGYCWWSSRGWIIPPLLPTAQNEQLTKDIRNFHIIELWATQSVSVKNWFYVTPNATYANSVATNDSLIVDLLVESLIILCLNKFWPWFYLWIQQCLTTYLFFLLPGIHKPFTYRMSTSFIVISYFGETNNLKCVFDFKRIEFFTF